MANMTVPSWALPTTGNLAYDDYQRSRTAWGKAHPFTGATLSNPTGGYDAEGNYVGPSANDWLSAGWARGMSGSGDESWVDPRLDAWAVEQDKAWASQLTPEQQAERARLAAERSAKIKRNGMLAALAGFGGIAGAGMLGAGMLGSGFGGAATGGLEAIAGAGGWDAATAAAWGSGAGLGGDTLSAMGLSGAAAGAAGGASPWTSFMKTLTSPIGNMATKAGGSLLSQLIAGTGNAYMGNKQAGQYDDVINQINQLYAPDSPYAKQMQQSLARKDAAAGRNSQYGSRAVELAAALTQAKSNALTSPGYGSLLANRGTNQNSTINGFLAALGSGPGQDLITKAGSGIGNYFQSMMGSEGEKYSPWQPNTGFDNSWMQSYAPG